jgi:hypothetical protein
VQVSHKTNELPERIVTIEGSEERRMKALEMVVDKIAEDPQHNMITTLVYNSTRDNNNSMDERDLSMDRGFSSQVANFMPALPVIQNNVASIAGLNNLSMLIVNSGGASQMTADSLMVISLAGLMSILRKRWRFCLCFFVFIGFFRSYGVYATCE